MTVIVKVTPLIQPDGRADYKGLDLGKIVGGTQLYPSYDNSAYFFYDGNVPLDIPGLTVVTQATYEEHKKRIESAPKPVSVEDRLAEIEGILFEAVMGGKL